MRPKVLLSTFLSESTSFGSETHNSLVSAGVCRHYVVFLPVSSCCWRSSWSTRTIVPSQGLPMAKLPPYHGSWIDMARYLVFVHLICSPAGDAVITRKWNPFDTVRPFLSTISMLSAYAKSCGDLWVPVKLMGTFRITLKICLHQHKFLRHFPISMYYSNSIKHAGYLMCVLK